MTRKTLTSNTKSKSRPAAKTQVYRLYKNS